MKPLRKRNRSISQNQRGWKLLSAAVMAQALLFAGCGAATPPAPAPVVPGPAPVIPPPAFDCLPITVGTPQINFNIAGGTIGQGKVQAGTIPQGNIGGGMTFGAVQILPAAIPPLPAATQLQGRRVIDGTSLSLNIATPAGGAALPNGGVPVGAYPLPYGPQMTGVTPGTSMVPMNFTGNGSILISPAVTQQLLQLYGGAGVQNPYMMGYPGYPGGFMPAPGIAPQPIAPGAAVTPGNVCVSGVAIDMSQTLYTNWLYLGTVYLYVNRSVHGLALDF